jgi:hypothetical protein
MVGLAVALPILAEVPGDGFLERDGAAQFPIGFYELPEDDAGLIAMAEAGVNLVKCGNASDLDRAQAQGMLGWMPLHLQDGPTDALKEHVNAVKDHPALAIWEGPDEVVWMFTSYSGLHRDMGIYDSPDEWKLQTPKAIAYSEEQAAGIIPNMRAAVEWIRSVDPHSRQVWFNEALETDVRFAREVLRFADITGCDIYPVKRDDRNVAMMAGATQRWKMIGQGKQVWMVMQAFSWNELGGRYEDRGVAYPSFDESRFMAYDVIAHGAKGILYWGSQFLTSDEFRRSLYAVTAELAALQPFLVAPEEVSASVRLVELPAENVGSGVAMSVRRAGDDWLIVLVNEDDGRHMGVEVSGLDAIEGKEVVLLYGSETHRVTDGQIIVRMQPREVKVFSTGRSWETAKRDGREYAGE